MLKAYAKIIKEQLVGYEIIAPVVDEENGYFGLHVQKGKSNLVVWIDADPEGNGCGHINIEQA